MNCIIYFTNFLTDDLFFTLATICVVVMSRLFEKNPSLITKLYSPKSNAFLKVGKRGRGRRDTRYVAGIALDESLNVFIADAGNLRIQVFTFEGYFVTNFGDRLLLSPYAIAVRDSVAVVSDVLRRCVYKFDGISCTKVIGSDWREIKLPMGLTIDVNYDIYVADAKRNSIVVLNENMRTIREFGQNELKTPRDVKLQENNVVVCDNSTEFNVHIFNRRGDLLKDIIKLKQGNGPLFMCIDKFSNIAITDKINREISISTFKGKTFQLWFTSGRPTGIVILKDGTIVRANFDLAVVYFH